jgi:hypothetical protein
MVSNFQVEFGKDSAGNRTLQTVPVYYGDPSRQASVILKNNSENALSAVPAMAAYISGLQYDREKLQNPYHEGQIRVREQVYDSVTQSYTGTQDGPYTVSRIMPAPYKLGLKLDIWTSNTDQKHQLIEQLVPLFNPGFEIQSTDNYVDWTSLSVVLLTNVTYSSRTVPTAGDDSQIDIATLEFELPIWLSLPAKVTKGGVVAQIIANIYDDSGSFSGNIIDIASTSQLRYTPMNYEIIYTGNTLTLYKSVNDNGQGITESWSGLVGIYGALTNGISQIRLEFDYPGGPHEIVGTVAYNPSNGAQLLFTPDPATLPANTLPAVTAIIDPHTVEVNSALLNPTTGTRYLILDSIGDANSESATVWQGEAGTNLVASANDIIQWTGTKWQVTFDSTSNQQVEYVTNIKTGVQYRWGGDQWVKAYEGIYRSGFWSLVL